MTVGALIKQTVSSIAPVYPTVYTGPEDHYFVYDIEDDRGDEFGDDDPDVIHYWIRLKYYYPSGENQTDKRNTVRDLLFGAGFTFADITLLDVPEDGFDGLAWQCEYIAERE